MMIQDGCITFLIVNCVLHLLYLDSNTPPHQDKQPEKAVRRARRPAFDRTEWEGIYYENVFEEGLVGPRPANNPSATGGRQKPGDTPGNNKPSAAAWSRFISRDTLEDEIKSLNRQLQSSVTTASRFNSQYADVRRQFSVLSTLFAIVHQYDQDVRWKKHALDAQIAFAEASVRSRAPSKQAFENARLRKQDLAELIRGGNMETRQDPQKELSWPDVVDRGTLMSRLESALQDALKPALADSDDFKNQSETLKRQAEMVAAIGEVLIQPGMDEAEEDGYRDFAIAMRDAAIDVANGVRNGNFEAAAQGINAVTQSCTDCHGEWR